jgi:hypothetical protein
VDGDTAMVIGGLIAGGLRFKSKRPVQTPRLGRAPMVRSLLFVLGLASATVLLA